MTRWDDSTIRPLAAVRTPVVARAVDDLKGFAPQAFKALLRSEAAIRGEAALRLAQAGEWQAAEELWRLAVDFAAEARTVEAAA